jgi:hypothetical protein
LRLGFVSLRLWVKFISHAKTPRAPRISGDNFKEIATHRHGNENKCGTAALAWESTAGGACSTFFFAVFAPLREILYQVQFKMQQTLWLTY